MTIQKSRKMQKAHFKKFIEKFTCLEMDEILKWLDSDPHPITTLMKELETHRPEWLKEIYPDFESSKEKKS
jgi:hypothetical protein